MKPSLRTSLLAAITLLVATPALALHVEDPTVDKGAFEIGYKGERFGDDDPDGVLINNEQGHLLEIGYGFTDDLFVALLAKGERDSEHSFHSKGYGIEAIYELTEQGEWWLSSGLYGEYFHHARESENPDNLEGKILLKRQDGPVTVTANLTVERGVGVEREHGVDIDSVVEAVYDLSHHFNPGIEWVAGWGNTSEDFADHSAHYVGPILTGDVVEFEVGKNQPAEIGYTIGYLWGTNNNAADNAIRFELEFETEF